MNRFQELVVISQLWQSSTNTTWLAQTSQGELVAVKIPNVSEDKRYAQRLVLEAWFLQRLADIDNMVPLLHFDTDVPEVPKLIMPYISGGSLSHRIYTGSLSAKQGAQIVSMVADTLQRIHVRGILHLDVNPSNILLDSAGVPFLTDFGRTAFFNTTSFQDLADSQMEEALRARSMTLSGGTREYMSPEQFDIPPMHLSPASDVYSLGIALFEVLARRKPYKSYANDLQQQRAELRELHKKGAIPDILELNPDLEEYIEAREIISSALQPRPEARYQHASALARDIRRVFGIGESPS